MAANRKSSTSKTARVMNLLSKNREEPMVAEQPPIPPEAPAPAAPTAPPAAVHEPAPVVHTTQSVSSTPTTPLISSMQADSVISHQVMSALESALDSELGIQPSAQQPAIATTEPVRPDPVTEPEMTEENITISEEETVPEPTPAPVIEPIAEPVVETVPEPAHEPIAETVTEEVSASVLNTAAEIVPEPVPVAVPETAPAENPPAPAEETPSPAPVQEKKPEPESAPSSQFKVDSNTTYVNVMETLVEEKAARYIDMFGLCKCPRCVADVKALALNNLNPKYVVMHSGEVIPRITLYENQFSAAVTAQILNACKTVMNSPRHASQ